MVIFNSEDDFGLQYNEKFSVVDTITNAITSKNHTGLERLQGQLQNYRMIWLELILVISIWQLPTTTPASTFSYLEVYAWVLLSPLMEPSETAPMA